MVGGKLDDVTVVVATVECVGAPGGAVHLHERHVPMSQRGMSKL